MLARYVPKTNNVSSAKSESTEGILEILFRRRDDIINNVHTNIEISVFSLITAQ